MGDTQMTKGLPATLEDAEMAAVEVKAVARARRYVRRLKSGAISAQPVELRHTEGAAQCRGLAGRIAGAGSRLGSRRSP